MFNSTLEEKWNGFGKYISVVAILWIFILIPYLAFGIVVLQFIFINLALNEIKNINSELKNPNLEQFYLKCLTGNIIKLIGLIILNIGAVMLIGYFTFARLDRFGPFSPIIPVGPILLRSIIILLIIGFIIMIIASSIEMRGWDELNRFLIQNKAIFPNKIAKDVIEGADNLRSGTLSWALGFLLVPIIIGWIYQMIGFFKLANIKYLASKEVIQPSAMPRLEPIPTPIQDQKDTINFCPLCGAKLKAGGKFCGECGAKID
ncbi:MAG: zinc ribbon domain-containing protein [Promethearchaeota archaeon]